MTVISEFFNARNLLLIFVNVLAFITIETLFFWYVSSRYVENLIDHKTGLISDYVSRDREAREDLIQYLNTNRNKVELPIIAEKQRQKRETKNIDLASSYILPVAIGLLGIIALLAVRIGLSRKGLRSTDVVLLFLVLFGFTTELYLYFVVVRNMRFISNNSIVYMLLDGFLWGFDYMTSYMNRVHGLTGANTGANTGMPNIGSFFRGLFGV